MVNNLRGRLEKAHIIRLQTNNYAYAKLREKSLLVHNGAPYVGRDCLVKLKPGGANFITSTVPEDFQDLAHNDYVLVGLWEGRMIKQARYPTLNEINQYFDPGSMPIVYYIDTSSSGKDGRVSINTRGANLQRRGFPAIVKKRLPDPNRASRVILTREQRDLDEIMGHIEDVGWRPILMEPLR